MTVYANTPISSICHVIDTTEASTHFSRFPAAISIADQQVEATLRALGDQATDPDTRVRRRVQIRHLCPNGDPFAICHASAFPERLQILGSIVEILWIQDGVFQTR